MNVLVLGGCGFIGSHLVDHLLKSGHKVRVFDRAPELFRTPLRTVEYRFGDFSDGALLAEVLEGVDVVYHLISTTVPSTSNLNPIADVQSNLIGTLQLLNLMVQKRIPKIVYLSSGGTVYGIPQSVPIKETHSLQPVCSYGVVKVAIENYLHMFYHLHNLKYVALRVANPYGERQGHYGVQGVIGTFIGRLINNEPIEIWGNGDIIRDYIYVGDLAKLCSIASKNDVNGIFNIGSGRGVSVNDIVKILSDITGREIKPIYKQSRAYDVSEVVLDINKIIDNFGWRPEINLRDGMHITWNWRKNLISN